MQQYRVNYSLLIGLIVGTLVCSGAVYALWRFQIERKSGWLLAEAEKAREAGDFREAARNYQQYLTIRSGDPATRIKYANASRGLPSGIRCARASKLSITSPSASTKPANG